jgi:hypothetical protein
MRSSRLLTAVNWKYAIGELVLITLGILVAIIASAGWERRQNDRQGKDYVAAMQADLAISDVLLDSLIAIDSISLARARRMEQYLRRRPSPVAADSIFSWIVLRHPRFEIISGTVDQLLQNGDLRLIRDDSIRVGVVRYVSKMRYTSDQSRVIEQSFHDTTHEIRKRLEVHSRWNPDGDSTQVPRTFNLVTLHADAALRGAYRNTITVQGSHLLYLRTFRDEHERLKALLLRRTNR